MDMDKHKPIGYMGRLDLYFVLFFFIGKGLEKRASIVLHIDDTHSLFTPHPTITIPVLDNH
jgi:hypothetical protein